MANEQRNRMELEQSKHGSTQLPASSGDTAR